MGIKKVEKLQTKRISITEKANKKIKKNLILYLTRKRQDAIIKA